MSEEEVPLSRAFSVLRQRGRYLAASIAAAAQRAELERGQRCCTDSAIAKLWKLSDQSGHNKVAALFDPDSGKALVLGDVLALPKALARLILTNALAALDDARRGDDEPDLPDTCAEITIALGKTLDDLRADFGDNGRVDSHEKHAANFGRLVALALRGQRIAQESGGGT